ncbi:MAG: hypothetical protein JXB62_23490 [Pirellulales bacterium]|nr:hypothetical protein [Pirellulales bacterium]
MDHLLPVPPELQHLIEKRQGEDRREAQRRGDDERRELDLGPGGALESAEDLQQVPTDDRREPPPRRQGAERRIAGRRRSEANPADGDPPEASEKDQ